MKNKNFSLMVKIMVTVNITTIILLLIFAYFIESNSEEKLENAAQIQNATLIETIKLTTADYIWNLNNDALKIITDKLIEDKSIEAVEFLDAKDKSLAKSSTSDNSSKLAYKVTTVKSDITYGKEKQKIGYISIKYNLNSVRDFREKLIKLTILAVILVQFIICAVLYFILRLTNRKLDQEFSKLKEISNITFSSSQESSEFSKNVSRSTTEQASAIQETVATLHQITEMVNTSVSSATNSSEKASISYDNAKMGQEVVKEMISSMKEINDSNSSIMDEVNKSNDRMKDIVAVINEISTKTNVINDIVFQTKLLSFNASVEAARAGEHGKGFAVVAEEVGNLAQMSGNAAKEISGLLEQSINRVNQIMVETNTGVEKVIKTGSSKIEQGVKTAEKCDTVLSEIVEIAIVVKNMMSEVAHASKEQAIGVHNITQAMTLIDKMVHANEDSANQSLATSEKLLEQSNELKFAITKIESEIFGTNNPQKEKIKSKEVIIKKVTEKAKDKPKEKVKEKEKTKEKIITKESPKEITKKVTAAPVTKKEAVVPNQVVTTDLPKPHVANKESTLIPSGDDSRFEDV